MSVRATVRLAAAALLAAILVAFGPVMSSAQASHTTGIEVSFDGITYSSEPDTSLFDDVGLLVPGDTVERVVWVRNATSSSGVLTVRSMDISSLDADFAGSFALAAAPITAALSADRTLAQLADCAILVTDVRVAPQQAVQIVVRLTMLDVADQIAQGDTGSVGFLATVVDDRAPAAIDSSCESAVTPPSPTPSDGPAPDPSTTIPVLTGAGSTSAPTAPTPAASGVLAFTGGTLGAPSLVAGALLGGGLFFLVAARRRTRDDAA